MSPPRRVHGRTVALALLAGLALGAGGKLYLRYYEPEVEIVEVGLRGDAAANPLLAAERLLPRLGYPVRRCDGEIELPPHDHVLFLLHRSPAVARLRQPELLDWIRRGGRLVVTPAMAGMGWGKHGSDPLLAAFGVDWKFLGGTGRTLPRGQARMDLTPVQDHAVVQVSDSRRLVDTRGAAAYAHRDERGPTMLVFRRGQGELIVLSSEAFLYNSWIGQGDNAAFLLWLVVGRRGGAHRPPPRGVELSLYDEMPALVTLLARHAWTALLPALLLVAALAWRAAARFGPLLADPPEQRRALLEHLEAAGHWLWYADGGRQRRTLVEGVRRGLRERLSARRPAWSRLAEPELIQRLGAAAGLPPQLVAEALHGPGIEDEIRFASTIRTLALLRRAL